MTERRRPGLLAHEDWWAIWVGSRLMVAAEILFGGILFERLPADAGR